MAPTLDSHNHLKGKSKDGLQKGVREVQDIHYLDVGDGFMDVLHTHVKTHQLYVKCVQLIIPQ